MCVFILMGSIRTPSPYFCVAVIQKVSSVSRIQFCFHKGVKVAGTRHVSLANCCCCVILVLAEPGTDLHLPDGPSSGPHQLW